MVSEAKRRAIEKYDSGHYEKLTVKVPIGTAARIRATGATLNGFISRATLAALLLEETRLKDPESPVASPDAAPGDLSTRPA